MQRSRTERLSAQLTPFSAQVALRRRGIDERIEIEMGRDDLGPAVQKRVQLLVRAHIEQGNRPATNSRVDEPALLRLQLRIDPAPEFLPVSRHRGRTLRARGADDETEHDQCLPSSVT